LVGICAISFSITLAMIVGNHLSNDALAVLSGIACGVGAAIPTGLLVVWIARRNEHHNQNVRSGGQYQTGQYPPVIVVNPGAQNQPQLPPPQVGGWTTQAERPAREFTIVGEGYEE
jgi:hypothetical protein